MRKRQGWLSWAVLTLALAISAISAQAQTNYMIVHSFLDPTAEGSEPSGQPEVIGPSIYGMTMLGGGFDNGAIFQVSTNGSGFHLLYSFEQGGTNGANPCGSLVFSSSDSSFYGMTFFGGTNGGGVIFQLAEDGSTYQVLHDFAGGPDDGRFPNGTPLVSGFNIYGMTGAGGTNGLGVVFTVDITGSGFQVVHSFSGAPNDGDFPNEGLVIDSSFILYGTTFYGGTNDMGTAFSINTDGSGFTILHGFGQDTNDAVNPVGALALDGSTLFGVSAYGGASDMGAIFSVNTDGSGYTLIHQFAGGTNDGAFPQYGSLVVVNHSFLYGATLFGGTDDVGVVFRMNLDGSEYTNIHDFVDNGIDGIGPFYGPMVTPSGLYGMTINGGTTNAGIIYTYPFPAESNDVTDARITDISIVNTNDVRITWTVTATLPHTDAVQFTHGDAQGGYTNNFLTRSPDFFEPAGVITDSWSDVGAATNGPSRYYRVIITP